MIVKSYKRDDIEILVVRQDNDHYAAIRLTNDRKSEYHPNLDYESATDTFEYWMEMENG